MRETANYALIRLFSPAVYRELAGHSSSPLFARLMKESKTGPLCSETMTVADAFDWAAKKVSRHGFRAEYSYRLAIINKILLGKHSLKTATALSEVRAGSCKADIVVLNGTSTAYEIKSERDTLNRLENQLHNYLKVFASATVVASPNHVTNVLNVSPERVGVVALTPRFTLQTIRPAIAKPEETSPIEVLEVLRTSEAIAVLSALGHEVPTLPNTKLRAELKHIFAPLDPQLVHNQMVTVLRESRSKIGLAEYLSMLPESLAPLGLHIPLNTSARLRVLQATRTPLATALTWR